MKISVATYSFHGLHADNLMDGFGCLETIRYRYGLHAVDLWNGSLGPDGLVLNPGFQNKVKEALESREMVMPNYHVDGCHVWWDTAAERAEAREKALAHLAAAHAMGAQTVRIDAGGTGFEWSDEQFEVIATTMREYAEFGHARGMRVGPESHWGPELVPDNMERLAKAVDHPGWGILLHCGHWEQATAAEGDRRLAPWAMATHVDQKTTETRLREAITILLDAGYDGYWGVEHHTGRNEYHEVACQVAAVRRELAAIASDEPERRPRIRKAGGMPDHIEDDIASGGA
jgi:sugar phosphate isomerase/epimerase